LWDGIQAFFRKGKESKLLFWVGYLFWVCVTRKIAQWGLDQVRKNIIKSDRVTNMRKSKGGCTLSITEE